MEHNKGRLSSGQHYGTARVNSLWSGSMALKWVNSPWNGNRSQQGDIQQGSYKKQQREKMILQILWHNRGEDLQDSMLAQQEFTICELQ